MLVCAFLSLCTRDRGCSAHPAFPAPSFVTRAGEERQNPGESRRGIAKVCLRNGCRLWLAPLFDILNRHERDEGACSTLSSSPRKRGPITTNGFWVDEMGRPPCFTNAGLWLWVPARASLGRDDGEYLPGRDDEGNRGDVSALARRLTASPETLAARRCLFRRRPRATGRGGRR